MTSAMTSGQRYFDASSERAIRLRGRNATQGEPKVVGDLQLVVWMLAQADRRSLDAPVASARQDDLAASVLQDAFAPIDFFRLVGRECVASAWIKYQSDDKAWRWWSVPLVTELMSDVDDGGLDIDEAWDLCRFLAEQCEVPD
ncbi:MAG: hypothetical protein ABWY80_06785, partial [Acidimicrobiia bacterium]